MVFPPVRSAIYSAHILVVDDEPEIAESLADLLNRAEGYDVTIARNGREAIAFLESAADLATVVDLVLLDVRMPGMSGPEVLQWLRNHSELKYTRVIMLTAAAGNEEKVEALSAGADDYITKPYYPQELLARVKTLLRSQQMEKQLQRQSERLVTLNRVSREVTTNLTTKEVLTVAVQGVFAVLGVELAAVYMAETNRGYLRCWQLFAPAHELAAASMEPVPFGQGVIGLVYSQRKSLCLDNPSTDPRFRDDLDAPRTVAARSLLATPLSTRGSPVGVLVAINSADERFSDVDRSLFTSLASAVSRALEITWLFQNVRSRQQELLESRNTLQAVIDGILHPIYTINEAWQLVAVNRTRSEEMGAASEELTGQTCYRVFFGRTEPCEHCAVASTLAEKEAHHWSVRQQGEDLQLKEWDVNAYPVPGSKAGSARAVVVWQDRTEERRLEKSLMQAGKLAAIGQLAAGVAHEINNPLTAINANAQLLQMVMSADHEHYESIDLITQAGERAAKVVRGLLDFARQTEYEFEKTDVNESIRQALNLVSYQFSTADIEVVLNLAGTLPLIKASWEHLQSVWLNLLINARDALQNVPGDRQIELTSRPEPTGKEVVVLVRDNGRGMSAGELSHIFEPFFTTKAPGQGTGLGLATCQRIIQQHGGQIEVVSMPGEGSTFIVHLPVEGTAESSED
ncbi:MAG: response regulator [Candidatus Promineifilaceae bacterium]